MRKRHNARNDHLPRLQGHAGTSLRSGRGNQRPRPDQGAGTDPTAATEAAHESFGGWIEVASGGIEVDL
jgi:hypothetical protein